MDLAYSKEHINTFVIVSGDSDFSPLVSKLKELGKHVIGLGMQESTSDLLRDNCDEFIYYEDLGKAAGLAPTLDSQLPETKRKAFRPAAGIAAGLAPREQGSPLVVDGQGHDEAQETVVQRGLSRLPHFQRTARRRAERRPAGTGDRQAQPHLRGDPLRLGIENARGSPFAESTGSRRRPAAKRRPASASRPPAANPASPEPEQQVAKSASPESERLPPVQAVPEVPPPPATAVKENSHEEHLIPR